jgi:ABC-type sugar transport system substrate-binding protein
MRIVFFNLQFFFKRVLLFFVLVFAITSCKNTAQKDASYTIGFSQCVGSDLWRKTMLEEMRMELSLHPNTNFIYEDANNNSDKQIKQVKKMLNEGIDLLIISPNEARPLTPIVEEAYHKGIPVIVIDRKTASDAYTAYVGADNYQIGKMAGQFYPLDYGGINCLLFSIPGRAVGRRPYLLFLRLHDGFTANLRVALYARNQRQIIRAN